jgi:hypothetical protein
LPRAVLVHAYCSETIINSILPILRGILRIWYPTYSHIVTFIVCSEIREQQLPRELWDYNNHSYYLGAHCKGDSVWKGPKLRRVDVEIAGSFPCLRYNDSITCSCTILDK